MALCSTAVTFGVLAVLRRKFIAIPFLVRYATAVCKFAVALIVQEFHITLRYYPERTVF